MIQAKEKSLIIVHNSNTEQYAEYLLGLISELHTSGIAINALVVDAKKFASYPPEQKNAKQKILYLGDYSESNLAEKNIGKWMFNQHGIRYGWHGNKGVIKTTPLSDSEFISLAEFAKEDMNKHNQHISTNVGKRGIDPFQRLKDLPLVEKIKLGVVALFSPFGAVAGLADAMGLMIKEKDNLDPVQMRDNQQKFAVLHFYLNSLADFMDIKDVNEE